MAEFCKELVPILRADGVSIAVIALRAAGHDVLWIRTDAPGIADQDVLAHLA